MSESVARPAAATAGLLLPLAALDRWLQHTGGPGIIPFELAGPQRSPRILRQWGSAGRWAAGASLVLDFPFLVAYTVLGIRLTRRAGAVHAAGGATGLGRAARAVAAVQFAAGACDAIENTALLGVVWRDGDAGLATIARAAARAKFVGLAIGWVHGGEALVRRYSRR